MVEGMEGRRPPVRVEWLWELRVKDQVEGRKTRKRVEESRERREDGWRDGGRLFRGKYWAYRTR
jgi:hypothetical protein